MRPSPLLCVRVLALVTLLLPRLAAADTLRLSGAATVAHGIIVPHRAAIEQASGLTLQVMANDESNGLKDLYAGRSDVAMVAAPIDSTERIINAAAPGSISTAGFQVAVIGSAQIKFVVNPANPVKALTSAQLKAIFTGAITNWKDLGGADQPIVVATGPVGMAARTNVVDGLLNGAEIVASAREIEGLNQIVRVVAEDPAAIGYGNAASITPGVSVIEGTEINETLGLATNGPPSPAVRKLIQAVMPFGAAMK